MLARERRVIEAFIGSVKAGELSQNEAVWAMEDVQRYPYLTEQAKELFYKEFEPPIIEPVPDPDLGLGEIPPTD